MRALILLIALSILGGVNAFAADVLIVQSGRGAAYTEALRGFSDSYQGSTQTIVLADYAEVDVVRLVKEEQPRLVLAVGDKALEASRKVRAVPVVSLLALSYNLAKEPTTISGVGMLPAPERYIDVCRSMGAKRVGVIYDPSRTGYYLQRAKLAAQQAGIELVVRDVRTPREALVKLEQLKGAVDALWLLPDTTAVAAETVEAYFLFSLQHKLPIITFSEQYLAKGAFAALTSDRTDMGRQAAELATARLKGGTANRAVDARTAPLRTNSSLGQKLGLPLKASAN
jgi:putative ABC transport system substrate-binding protein